MQTRAGHRSHVLFKSSWFGDGSAQTHKVTDSVHALLLRINTVECICVYIHIVYTYDICHIKYICILYLSEVQ